MLGGFAGGPAKVTVDQRARKLLLSPHELESVRLELVAARIVFVQRLTHCNEPADGSLDAFDVSHRR